MTTKNDETPSIENEQFGVLEGMLTPLEDAIKDNDLVELCLHVYGKAEGPMSVQDLVTLCREEFKNQIDSEQVVQTVNRMISTETLIGPGYVAKTVEPGTGVVKFGVTDKGYAYLWDKLAQRNSDEVFDKFGRVIAINKKLNDPNREVESHDLFAISLLAVLRLRNQKSATATDVRKIVESWAQPSGRNLEVNESERKYPNPLNVFQRKFTNVFSSHNQIVKNGLMEKIADKAADEGTWRVTEKGKAVLMRRIQKDRRNLTLQMRTAALHENMGNHVLALQLITKYATQLGLTQEQSEAFLTVTKVIGNKVREDQQQIHQISIALATPETANTAKRLKPRV